MIRVLLPQAKAGPLAVTGPAHHYLWHVLRLRAGDTLEAFDGGGTAFPAKVIFGDAAELRLELGAGVEAAALRSVTVVQALPKADKLELVLQKCTELGATVFALAHSTRCVAKPDADRADRKLERWQRIAGEAARQCGRADVPLVLAPVPLLDAVKALPQGTAVVVLDEEERALPLRAALATSAQRPLALVVGPEGGWTRDEVAAMVAAGATAVTLGRSVLRSETAALVALAVVRHLDGALG